VNQLQVTVTAVNVIYAFGLMHIHTVVGDEVDEFIDNNGNVVVRQRLT